LPHVYAMRIHADTDRGDLDCQDEIRSTTSYCLFAGGTPDRLFRAFNARTGDQLELPAALWGNRRSNVV
jgi:hypothetical protein